MVCEICGSTKFTDDADGCTCAVCGTHYSAEKIKEIEHRQEQNAPAPVNTSFLRVARFGGFDRDDVLTFIDSLNWYIFYLEGEKARLESGDHSKPAQKTERPSRTTLRTVRFGGFAKNDVINYADELSKKIADLESEIKALKGEKE